MGCCGQGRADLRARTAASRQQRWVPVSPPPEPLPQRQDPPLEGEVGVEYLGDAPTLVCATATGRSYTFSPGRRIRHVPTADAGQLLLDPIFKSAVGDPPTHPIKEKHDVNY